jgi:hypothetical protein
VAPGRPASGGSAKFRPTAGWGRPGTGGGGALGPRGPIPVLGWGREETGEGRRRRPATVAAATVLPARWRLCGEQEHAGELGGVQRKVGERLIWRAVDRSPELAMAANNGAGGAQGGGGAGVRRGEGAFGL